MHAGRARRFVRGIQVTEQRRSGISPPPVTVKGIAISVYVCMLVCLFVCLFVCMSVIFPVHVACDRGSVLF